MQVFEYFIEHSNFYDFDTFYDSSGNWYSSQRKCFIDALQKIGITDIPFDSMTEYALEMLCLQNKVYVKFLET